MDRSAETAESGAPQGAGAGGAAEEAGGSGIADRTQTRQDDTRLAAARRAGRREAEAELAQRIRATRIPDPTRPGKNLETLEDLEAYSERYHRAAREKQARESGKTVEELEREEQVREAGEQALRTREEENRSRDFVRQDLQAFRAVYPDVDIGKLERNEAFRRFCGSRYGKEPLASLYADWLAIMGDARESAQLRQDSREERSTGSGRGGNGVALNSREQQALDEWNAAYPDMRMTAKEFMER